MKKFQYIWSAITVRVFALLVLALTSYSIQAASSEDLNRDAEQALNLLYKTNPTAANISKQSKAKLVFPKIIKAGLIFGGAYGEGVLLHGTNHHEYFNSVSASWGWQVGAESFGYVVFLMNDKAINYLSTSHGWEIGVGPSIVMVNDGVGKNFSTSTLKEDAYAFIFDQQGLMLSLSLEGTKISPIKR